MPSLVVLHYTVLRPVAAAAAHLCDPATEVSAHWLIAASGEVHALVDEERRAWHAGPGTWGGVGDVNSRSIGIELDNDGRSPFAAPLMDALEELLTGVLARWDIPPKGVIGHQDFAPTRKVDPGPRFDWRRLARQGLSVWPEVAGAAEGVDAAGDADAAAMRAALCAFGYPADTHPDACLAAFRNRFRPTGAGPLDARDLALARDLAARFPVDAARRGA